MKVKFNPVFTGSIEQKGLNRMSHLVSGPITERMFKAPANTTLYIGRDGENANLLAIMFKIGKDAVASLIGSEKNLTEGHVNSVITRGLEILNERAASLGKLK